jgi:hypothetical protein
MAGVGHLLEQLAALHPPSENHASEKVVSKLLGAQLPNTEGLCEALLQAWVAARQNLTRKMQRELADAVVGAVRVWQQQQEQEQQLPPPQQQREVALEGGRRKRQCTGKVRGR